MHWFLTCSLLTLLGLWLPVTPTAKPSDDWNAKVLEIAKTYPTFGRVDRLYRWSPTDCDMPRPKPPSLHVSKSDDDATHGQKLYTVFAKDTYWDANIPKVAMSRTKTYLPPYVQGSEGKTREAAVVGQIVVKEAWEPIKVNSGKRVRDPRAHVSANDPRITQKSMKQGEYTTPIFDHGDILIPYASKGDQDYEAGPRTGLFIMFKVDPKTPGTDQGWVYATVGSDLKTITGIGVIASCAKCHQEAKHDRLFGLR